MSTQLRKTRLWIIAALSAVAGSGCMPLDNKDSHSYFDSICIKENVSMIGFGGGFSLTGSVSINGDVLFFDPMGLFLSGNSCVQGKVYLDRDSRYGTSGHSSVTGGVQQGDFSHEKELLMKFASSISALPATQELDSISGSTEIVGRGGVNVIHVRKGIDLKGSDRVVLRGGDNDTFILNVDGDINLRGNARIVTMGGLSARSVAINSLGSGADVSLAGTVRVSGTVIAMNRGFTIFGNCQIEGTIVAGLQIKIFGNGAVFNPGAFCVHDGHHEHEGDHDGDDDGVTPSPSPTVTATPAPSATPDPTPTASPDPAPAPSVDPSPAPTSDPSTPCGSVVCGGGSLGV